MTNPRVRCADRASPAKGGGDANGSLVHWLGCDPADASIGMRVRAVFEDERNGGLADIRCFEPV